MDQGPKDQNKSVFYISVIVSPRPWFLDQDTLDFLISNFAFSWNAPPLFHACTCLVVWKR